jgi:hypothetical protein
MPLPFRYGPTKATSALDFVFCLKQIKRLFYGFADMGEALDSRHACFA